MSAAPLVYIYGDEPLLMDRAWGCAVSCPPLAYIYCTEPLLLDRAGVAP